MKNIEILFKNIILKLFLLLYSNKNNSKEIKSFNKVLLIRLNKIGDALVTTPFIEILKNQYPNIIIDILADKKNKFIFYNNSNINNVFVYQKEFLKVLKQIIFLNKNKYDLVIDLHDDVSTTVTFLIGVLNSKYKLGLSKTTHKIYSHTSERIDSSKYHIIERLNKILELFNIDIANSNSRIKYNINLESINKTNLFLNENQLTNQFLVGINISAGNIARSWGIDNYQKLISYLSNYDVKIILLCSPSDEDLVNQLLINNKNTFYKEIFRDFDTMTAMISKLTLIISPDTSVVHLASAFEIPTFGLYVHYNTNDIIWYPYNCLYEAIITKEATLNKITYIEFENKFKPFFRSLYEKYFNSRL